MYIPISVLPPPEPRCPDAPQPPIEPDDPIGR